MNQISLYCVAAVTVLVALNTVWRLICERDRLAKEDLSDEDRSFAWTVVVFLVFPVITALDLRATQAVCEQLGGYLKSCTYGLLWYQAIPAGLPQEELIPVLFSGSIVAGLLCLSVLPSLLFRPHPFLSLVVGYTVAFVLGVYLIFDPILSLTGLGGLKWQLALTEGAPEERAPLIATHVALAVLYLLVIRNTKVRLWFSALTRPNASEELQEALYALSLTPNSARLAFKVGLLYDKAGLKKQAKRQLKKLRDEFNHALYASFLNSLIAYRTRDYKNAKRAFIYTSDFPGVDGELKASLLAAGSCAAFGAGDLIGALNLCERALEFDDACLVARMVKVDVFLRQGKKEQAGEEILSAMRLGLTLDLENRVPLDTELAYEHIVAMEEARTTRQILQMLPK